MVRGRSVRTTTTQLHEEPPAPEERRIGGRGLRALLGGAALFTLGQALLVVNDLRAYQAAHARGLIPGFEPAAWGRVLTLVLVGGGIAFVGFALAGMIVAAAGHRLLFVIPAAVFVLLPVVQAGQHLPQPLGPAWVEFCSLPCPPGWFVWMGALLDLALVWAPGFVVASGAASGRWGDRLDGRAAASITLAVALVVLTFWTVTALDREPEFRAVAAVVVFGLAAGATRPWWPWAHLLFPAVAGGALAILADAAFTPDPSFPFSEAVPFVSWPYLPLAVLGLLASSWTLLSNLLRRPRSVS